MVEISDTVSTAFEIVGIGMIPTSARGIKCRYQPIENGQIHYTVNAVAVSTARPQFNLFEITLSCEDVWPPGFVSLTRGQAVTIYGDDSFIQLASLGQVRPSADGVGVVVYYDANMAVLPSSVGATWMRYRPVMTCLVADFSIESDEWGGLVSWSHKFKETR